MSLQPSAVPDCNCQFACQAELRGGPPNCPRKRVVEFVGGGPADGARFTINIEEEPK